MVKPSPACIRRLRKEFKFLQQEPVPNIEAMPLEENILEWHYCITGPKDTPYYGGFYHGKIKFPPEYPYKPPSIYMITPSGRFKTNVKLCFSMSDFHPEEWSCMWSVSSILSGVLSFMTSEDSTLGSIETSREFKLKLAQTSLETNLKNRTFLKLFPHYVDIHRRILAERAEASRLQASQQGATTQTVVSSQATGAGRWPEIVDHALIVGICILLFFAISYMY